jgi:arginine-tRNA-protein transferase
MNGPYSPTVGRSTDPPPAVESYLRYVGPCHRCAYLSDRYARIENEYVIRMTADEYVERLFRGWRRFGKGLFRPRCSSCSECRSLRIDAAQFRPDRSQRRNRQMNEGVVRLRIGRPSFTPAKLELYDRYHQFMAQTKDWPERDTDADDYRDSFVNNPFPTEEWRYEIDGELVGVGYVDELCVGLSAIYFFHAPEHRARGLGTWNVMQLIDQAHARQLLHVYLGYYVADCPSLAYKARFVPNQLLARDGKWHNFRM